MLQRYKQPRTSKSNTVAAQKHLTVMYVSAGPILSVYAVLNTRAFAGGVLERHLAEASVGRTSHVDKICRLIVKEGLSCCQNVICCTVKIKECCNIQHKLHSHACAQIQEKTLPIPVERPWGSFAVTSSVLVSARNTIVFLNDFILICRT